MNQPWWRAATKQWMVYFHGKQKKLGYDEHGEGKKHPPKEIAEVWHKLERTEGNATKDMLYSELAELYLATIKHPKTHRESKRQIDWFLAFIGKIKTSEIRVHHITRYLETKPTWNSTSQAIAIERITRVLNWAQQQGYIDGHKVKLSPSQKPRRKRRVVIVAAEHAEAIENACYPRLRALLAVLRLSGSRPGELCTLTIDKLDLENGRAFVFNKTRESTNVEYRPLYLPQEAVEIIRQQVGSRKEGHVFRAFREGRAFTPHNLAREVRRKRRALGLPESICPYASRHNFAGSAIRNGVSVAHVARLMGHVDISQMKVYFHEEHDDMREAIEKANKNG